MASTHPNIEGSRTGAPHIAVGRKVAPYEQEPALMTVAEAARRFNFSTATIRRRCDDGTIPAIRIGRQWRIDPDAATVMSISESGPRPATGRLRNR